MEYVRGDSSRRKQEDIEIEPEHAREPFEKTLRRHVVAVTPFKP